MKIDPLIQLDKIDSSPNARTLPNNKLRKIIDGDKMYEQIKVYKGHYCLGVKWVEVK